MSQVREDEAGFDPDGFMDPGISANPQPYYRLARDQGAVVEGTFGPQIVRRAECEYALQHPEDFCSAMEAVDLGQSVPMIPLQVDPPDHLKYRKLLDPLFAPRQMNKIEPDIARFVNELIDGFIDRGECDFATDLAVPLPSTVFLRLIGLPISELDLFLSMKDGILRPAGADLDEMKVSQKKAAEQIESYFAAALDDRRRSRQDDLLSMFLDTEVDGQKLTTEEILGICFLFILAGLDTVTDSLECFYAYLAQHPDHRRRIVEDPSVIPSAVEEMLRWESPVTGVPRMATRDIDLGGCPVAAGAHIGVSIGSANCDERALPDAYTVDFDRNPNKHLAFGGGIHRCLGSHLARLELRTTLREWHQRIPEYSLVPGTELTYQMGLRQIDTLPLVFHP
ncbi:MAG TPA: cytochrome P450 [Acidimicrobiales bacterium]|nr:cytochrome P450 [Acidimicrobiales bacterium]